MSSAPAVSVVVLSWNRRQDTLDCLASLAGVTYPALSVICVDNGSSDGSPDAVAASFPDIRLVRLDANTGFAAGMNTGIRAALEDGAEHVLMLNNDMVVTTSVVEPLVGAVTGDPLAAAACAQVPSDPPDRIWYAGATYRERRGYHGRHLGYSKEPLHPALFRTRRIGRVRGRCSFQERCSSASVSSTSPSSRTPKTSTGLYELVRMGSGCSSSLRVSFTTRCRRPRAANPRQRPSITAFGTGLSLRSGGHGSAGSVRPGVERRQCSRTQPRPCSSRLSAWRHSGRFEQGGVTFVVTSSARSSRFARMLREPIKRGLATLGRSTVGKHVVHAVTASDRGSGDSAMRAGLRVPHASKTSTFSSRAAS